MSRNTKHITMKELAVASKVLDVLLVKREIYTPGAYFLNTIRLRTRKGKVVMIFSSVMNVLSKHTGKIF